MRSLLNFMDRINMPVNTLEVNGMKPIIFSTPMIKAILDGTKTMTRRVVLPQPSGKVERFVCYNTANGVGICDGINNKIGYPLCKIKQKYQVGDTLWVRETFTKDREGNYIYKADPIFDHYGKGDIAWNWTPSIFMPKEAARIFLKVRSVRIERLNEITEEDAKAEGVEPLVVSAGPINRIVKTDMSYKRPFTYLWDRLNKRRGYLWESNHWVWVYEFTRAKP